MDESKIKDTTIFLMIFTALCFDGGQLIVGWIPIFGNIFADIVSFFAFMTFLLWFKMNGIQMMTPKRFGSLVGGGVVEMVPFLNILPAWTMVVVYLIGTTKIQELAQKNPMLASMATSAGQKIKSLQKKNDTPDTPITNE